MLIGLDFYCSFVTKDNVRKGSNEPAGVRTSLDSVFCGPTGGHGQECTVTIIVQIGVEGQLNETLELGIHWYEPYRSSPSTNPSKAMVLKR